MLSKRIRLFLFLLLCPLLAGCTFVRVQNITDARIHVQVQLPDGTNATKAVPPGDIADYLSANGGAYTMTVVPSEAYEATLRNLQTLITRRLFTEASTLTAAEVAQLTENLNAVDRLLADLAQPGAGCSGTVPDFETAVAVVSWDPSDAKYVVSCAAGS